MATAAVAALEGHRTVALLHGIVGAWWECECGAPLDGSADTAQDALDIHLVDIVRDAIATVRTTASESPTPNGARP